MKISGEFVNRKGELIGVEFESQTAANQTNQDNQANQIEADVVIGEEGSGVSFGADAVEVSSEMNDTLDVLLTHSARVRLWSENYIAALYGRNCMDVGVKITRSAEAIGEGATEKEVVFKGWVEPMAYSQGYNEVVDEVEVECVDCLSALQYSNYKKVGQAGVDYDTEKGKAGIRTLWEVLNECLGVVSGEDDAYRIWWDGSRSTGATDTGKKGAESVFGQIQINDILFFDDDEDSVWTMQEVVEEVLKYLGVHIEQRGADYYIFSWERLRAGEGWTWTDLRTGETMAQQSEEVEISNDNVADDGTKINVGEVYNQIKLKCTVKEQSTVVENPLDDDGLIKMFGAQQKYLTEYGSDGDGSKAQDAMAAMLTGADTDYGAAYKTEWYVRVYRHIRWKFPVGGDESKSLLTELFGASSSSEKRAHQEKLPNYLSEHVGAGLMSLGKVEKKADNTDNSPVNKIEETKYMIIGVNGNGLDDAGTYQPNNAALRAAMPVVVYNGAVAGGSFSPADEDTTNYFVIKGTIRLNQRSEQSELVVDHNDYGSVDGSQVKRYKGYNEIVEHLDERRYGHLTAVSANTNQKGRIYVREYWTAEDAKDDPDVDESRMEGLIVPTEKKDAEYEYKYSAIGERKDTVSKVGVLQCMLIVGKKCVVESQTGVSYSDTDAEGAPVGSSGIKQVGRGKYKPEYAWKTYKTLEECGGDIDEWAQQSFTIGFDPKIGDKLVGTDFEIANNIDYTMGLDDEKGTAIPIKKSDKVSGRVVFKILGPVNLTWDVITRRHPTFFRHTKWSAKSVPLMAHVSNILIKDFEITMASDNGGLDAGDDGDLVYMSDTDETFVNKKDDLEMKIQSGLTSAEASGLGVSGLTKLSTAMDAEGLPLMSVKDEVSGETAKAEQLYVDACWQEWHEPKVEMEQALRKDANRWGIYKSGALDKRLYVEGMGWNGDSGEWAMKMKEV